MQKRVQQETANSAVVVNDHIYVSQSLPISFFQVSMTPFWVKNDNIIGTGIHMIIHYRQFLVALVFADLSRRLLVPVRSYAVY